MTRDPARNDRRMEWLDRAITRKHDMDVRPLQHVFRHTNRVAAVAAYVSILYDMRGSWQVDALIYHLVRSGRVSANVTQTAIRRGVAAAKNIDEPEQAPDFKNPAITFRAGQWRINPVAGGYVVHAGIGSRAHPHHIQFGIPKRVGDLLTSYDVGELTLTPTTYTITYTKYVPNIREAEPHTQSVLEIQSGISYLQPEPEPLLAVDMNGWGAMAGDGHTITKLNLHERIKAVEDARKSTTPTDAYRTMKDDIRYERRHGHKKTNRTVQQKRETNHKKHGGSTKHAKLGHRLRNIKDARKAELKELGRKHREELKVLRGSRTYSEAEWKRAIKPIKMRHGRERAAIKEKYARNGRELKAARSRCVQDKPRKRRVNNQERQQRVSKAGRALDHAMNAAACVIVAWAVANNATIILEDLKGMPRGWSKFNKRTRTRLYASAMMKFQRLICEKARWNGVEVLYMDPRNTSALCCACGGKLAGDYHCRTCGHCVIRVDRDVNAVLNMLRTAAAARYGRRVRPSLDEARSLPDIILGPGRVVREGVSLRVDGELDGFG